MTTENKHKIDLLIFQADWCSTCQTMDPIVKNIQEEFENRINFVFIDADSHPGIVSKLKIRSIPTYIIFRDGKEITRVAGLLSKSEFTNKLERIRKE